MIRELGIVTVCAASLFAGCAVHDVAAPANSGDGGAVADGAGVPVPRDAQSEGAALGPSAGDASTIAGRVVDQETDRPLADRTVTVGSLRTVTDGDGAFALAAGIPAPFDVFVVEPDNSAVSVFRGVTRRDLVLPHLASAGRDPVATAHLAGALAGGGSWPLSGDAHGALYVFTAAGDSHLFFGSVPPTLPGPSYGPLEVWLGLSRPTPATIAAFFSFAASADADGGVAAPEADDAGSLLWYAIQTTSFAVNETKTMGLLLAPAQLRSVAAALDLHAGLPATEVEQYYRWPLPNAVVPLGSETLPDNVGAFQLSVPDLSSSGGTLCVAGVNTTNGRISTELCGTPFDTDSARLTLQPPPSVSAPSNGAVVLPQQVFSWTGFPGGISELNLTAAMPSPESPTVHVWTASESASWPDLSSLGMTFPLGADYVCTVTGVGPYDGIDAALGPDGAGGVLPVERRSSESLPVAIATP